MREPRSADPWSSFLDPRDSAPQERYASGLPGGGRAPAPPEATQGLTEPSRRILDLVQGEDGEVRVGELGDRLGLGLLEVADAVRILRARQLIEVLHTGAREAVRARAAGLPHQAGD